MAPKIFILIMKVYFFSIREYLSINMNQLESARKQIHKSLQNCGSLEWNLIYVSILAPRI